MECYPLLGDIVELVLLTGATINDTTTTTTTTTPLLDLKLTNFTGRLIVRPRTTATSNSTIGPGYKQQSFREEIRTSEEPLGALDDPATTLVDHNRTDTTRTTTLPPIVELPSQSDIELDETEEDVTAEEQSPAESSSLVAEEGEVPQDKSERVANNSALEATDPENVGSTEGLEGGASFPDGDSNENIGGSGHVASKSPLDRLKRVATGAVANNIISGVSGLASRRTLSPSTENASQNTSFLKWGGGGSGSSHSKRGNRTSKEKPVSRSLSWHKLMQIYSVKKHIPPSVRQKRLEQRRAARSANSQSDSSVPFTTVQPSMGLSYPSRLHELCGEPDATLSELLAALETNKHAVFQTDHLGRLPLHILGDNEGLIGSSQGKQVASAFAWKLMEANSDALVAVDNQGLMPFAQIIVDWVEWVYESHKLAKQAATPQSQSRGRDPINSFLFSRQCEDVPEITRMFPTPEVWDEVEWCINMISLGMDELAGKSGLIIKASRNESSRSKKTDSMRRDIACHLISVVPQLVKTVLLIQSEGGATRRRIVRTSLFRRIFLCKECVGTWLTLMLRKSQPVSRRGVDLLEYISESTISDYTGGFKAATAHDAERYHEERNSVFEAVNKLDGTLASLAMLENRETERAAGTPVIWFMMKERLARPFVLGLVLVDLILHISLMIAFRNSVRLQESVIGAIDIQSANFICVHYLLRKGCEALALLSISPSLFKKFAKNLWTIVDILTIVLTMAAFTWGENNPNTYRNGFNALVVGLLWVKVVGFLKVVNKDMSTFILALFELIGDIKYFLVVLVVVIFMFGDMFHIAVSTKDDGTFCQLDDLEGPTEDFCSPNLGSYLRVYSMLIGDFELNDLKDTQGITTIYVIFTSLGVVCLLNVLIAVICRSYEKATNSSAKLFGRARVNFIAQNEALEIFLHPGAHAQEAFRRAISTKWLLSRLFRIFRLFTLFAILATALTTAIFLASHGIRTWMRSTELDVPTSSLFTATLMLAMFLILIFALAVLIGFSLESLVEQPTLSTSFSWVNECTYAVVRRLALPLFGTHSREQVSCDEADEKDDSLQKAVESTKKEMISEMAALETRLCEHFATMLEDKAAESTGRNLTTVPRQRGPQR